MGECFKSTSEELISMSWLIPGIWFGLLGYLLCFFPLKVACFGIIMMGFVSCFCDCVASKMVGRNIREEPTCERQGWHQELALLGSCPGPTADFCTITCLWWWNYSSTRPVWKGTTWLGRGPWRVDCWGAAWSLRLQYVNDFFDLWKCSGLLRRTWRSLLYCLVLSTFDFRSWAAHFDYK